MKFSFSLTAILIYFLLLSVIAINYGCANLVPPSGGPIDTLPPRLTRAIPKDSALLFAGNKLVLQFDEFIELKNPNDQIIISPYPATQPLINANLKTISIKLKDSLLPNTTYTIDFGNAIADINEGNILKDFQYSFATGIKLDTHSLSGFVFMAETGKADSTVWALLYREEDDSTVAKKNPAYVARVNSKGFFQFNNLREGKYYVFALKDADGNKRYNQPIEAFAFLDTSIVVPYDADVKKLYAFATEKEKKRESAREVKKTDKLTFTTNLEGSTLELTDTLFIQFAERLVYLDTNALYVKEDTLTAKKIESIQYNAERKKIILNTNFKAGLQYQIILPKDFAKDSSGRTFAKNDTLRFRVKSEKEYGSLKITFRQLDLSKNPVVQLTQNDQIFFQRKVSGNELYVRLFKPGTYQLQLLYDINNNGRWDPGDYFAKPRRQPEIVQYIDKEIFIKQNWDNEFKIDIPNN
jgi:uncharacterized protein (DUF2141 family)